MKKRERQDTIPEGPELATSRDQLRAFLVGKRLTDIQVVGGRFAKSPPDGLKEILEENSRGKLRIDSIDTKGKFMWWTMGSWRMWCTYGMSGQWSKKMSSHTAIVLECEDDSGTTTTVYFNDQRRFGTIKFVNDKKSHEKKLASLGPDVLGAELTPEIFAKNLLVKPDRPICEALMDQSCVSGIGNYIRAEAMWLARVDPWKPVCELSSQQILDLCESATSVSKNSYRSGGATIHTYESPSGKSGEYSSRFVVYGRKVDADGNAVSCKKDSNGRTVHWSPDRQP